MTLHYPGFGVYVHWPFCETVCPYCDFNVHVNQAIEAEVWRDALLADLDHYAAETAGRTLTSLYFGGGTPSLMPTEITAALIEAAKGHWQTSDDIEITLEVNPTSAEQTQMQAFKDAGINRVSLGVQSFDDGALTFLGRTHTGRDALSALEIAERLFGRVTFDLIYGLPDQEPSEWIDQLRGAIKHAGGHLSLYQLTIESGTPFFKQNVLPAEEEAAADMYEQTQDILNAAGMPGYEVSNHAKPGEESRHNLTCWRGGDYLGIGPGAHGRLTLEGTAYGTHQIHSPKRWLEKVSTQGHGTAKRRTISQEDRARELIMMGLRLSEGIDKSRFAQIIGLAPDAVISADAKRALVDEGLLQESESHLVASPEGRQRLNALLSALLN